MKCNNIVFEIFFRYCLERIVRKHVMSMEFKNDYKVMKCKRKKKLPQNVKTLKLLYNTVLVHKNKSSHKI